MPKNDAQTPAGMFMVIQLNTRLDNAAKIRIPYVLNDLILK